MKHIILLIFAVYSVVMGAQEASIKKPDYVIIANDQIITKEQLNEYAKEGYIKGINKGVSEETRNEFATKFGDKIGDRAFIITIDLFTEEEKKANQNKLKTEEKPDTTIAKDTGLILNVNDAAQDFEVKMLTGETIKLSDLKGKVVLLNFWATWCAPCLMEFYEMPSKILKPFEDKDFVFLPISRGETETIVSKKMLQLKEKGIDFNVGLDPNKTIWNQYATKFIPKNFIIDKDGVIQYISTGNYEGSVDTIAKEIEKLLTD